MAVHTELKKSEIDKLLLDSRNPRLGRENVKKKLPQDAVLKEMQAFSLEELATSVLTSGFWPQEALIAVEEKVNKKDQLVVVEGNRRLAALKLLKLAQDGNEVPNDWKELYDRFTTDQHDRLRTILADVPYFLADSRKDVQAYLGFRHVTGIKQWDPAEKAEYISTLIESGMSYKEVTDAIGSKVHSVRQNYISYRILLQMEEQEEIHVPTVEQKFSVLTLSLRTDGVQSYLGVTLTLDTDEALEPIPPDKLDHLVNFATWLFGNKKKRIDPLITDSRKVERFGKVLSDAKAVAYLEKTKQPNFEIAYRIAGGDASDVADHLQAACFSLEEALGVIHLVSDVASVRESAERLVKDTGQLLSTYPEMKSLICGSN